MFRIFLVLMLLLGSSCGNEETFNNDILTQSESGVIEKEVGGSTVDFKVPISGAYEWQVTQSWADHCEECNTKGYDKLSSIYKDFCALSHSEIPANEGCIEYCKYSWDFNLSQSTDLGKPVLASGNGVVKKINTNPNGSGWGNFVVLDHGDNLCTRYAHLQTDSILVEEGEEVCQGLKLAGIGGTPNFSPHLHFQFENCDTKVPIARGFTDGNGIPKCTIGDDIKTNGVYTFLKLTNVERESCDDDEEEAFGEAELPENNGWVESECGTFDGCPLNPNCGKQAGHKFGDHNKLSTLVADAAGYLYQECAIQGKNDGKLHPEDKITRAEALKIALYLFGMMDGCDDEVPFTDVGENDWYYEVVACAVDHGIVDTKNKNFNPNQEVNFVEAAKFLVEAADDANVITIKSGGDELPKIDPSHWGHKYVQTIYEYGGISSTAEKYSADQKIPRGEYIIMAASLSPCFCGNVQCEDGCQCNQETFACSDPNDNSPGVGGGGGGNTSENRPPEDEEEEDIEEEFEEEEEEFEEEEEEVEEEPEEEFPELTLQCQTDEVECIEEDLEIEIECSVTNEGQNVVKINNLVIIIQLDACWVTDDDLQNGGVGYQSVDPGETKKLSGHFKIVCSYVPKTTTVAFDLVVKEEKDFVTYDEFLEAEFDLPKGEEENCKAPEIPDGPNCTPQCSGKTCGSDGCDGSCGICPEGSFCNASAQCEKNACVPQCAGKQCGADGCSGTCGTCAVGYNCVTGQCKQPPCPASCNGKVCGNDGCGGSCGTCPSGKNCNGSGQCVAPPCVPQCSGKECGSDGCGSSCGNCASGYNCDGGFCEKEDVPGNAAPGALTLWSPGGTLEIATANWWTYYKSDTLPEGNLTITFTDQDLPAMVLIHSGPQGFKLDLLDLSYAPLDFYIPYDGPLTFTPKNEVVKANGANLPNPYLNVLVRIPSKN